MPKVSNKIDWENTEVSFYKFVCNNPEIKSTYVGHTTNFASRKYEHKGSCNNLNRKNHNIPLYVFMRENGGFENWSMVQIHSQICKDSLEARQIEQELIEQQQLKLNVVKAFISEEQRLEYEVEYRLQHKEEIAKYKKQPQIADSCIGGPFARLPIPNQRSTNPFINTGGKPGAVNLVRKQVVQLLLANEQNIFPHRVSKENVEGIRDCLSVK